MKTRILLRWILPSSILAFVLGAMLLGSASVSSQRKPAKGASPTPVQTKPGIGPQKDPSATTFENFDIRVRVPKTSSGNEADAADSGQLKLEVLKPKVSEKHVDDAEIRKSMLSAQQKLEKSVPNLQVQFNDTVRVPEIVSVSGGQALAQKTGSNEDTLRSFLADNAALYGLTSSQVSDLVKVSEYTNPAGNLSFVEFQQEVNGIRVFQGYIRGVFSANGNLVRTTGLLAPVNQEEVSSTAKRDPIQAVAAAAASIRVTVDPDSLLEMNRSKDGRITTVSRGPFDDDPKVELIYFPLAPGQLILAYSMTLWEPDYAYMIIVDANTGQLLWRKNITQDQTQTVTYNIYNNDSPTPSSPTACAIPSPCALPPGITRTDQTLVSENVAADNLGWIPDGAGNAVTTGNNVDAGLDLSAPNGIDTNGRATGTGRTFSFPYIPDGAADPTGSNAPSDANYRMGIVTNIFFWTNRYHDLMYNFGFTEPARNFQTDNFGRGGLGNDFVRAEAQDSSGTNNANFSTPADGSLPRMQMFIFTTTPVNRDGDLDAEVFYHELTHGTSNRLHANATGLNSQESAGMGEGWSDYYARALRGDASENVDGLYASGGYVTKNYYYGIRRFPYAVRSNVGANGKPHNPTTFADIDPTQINLSDGAFPPAFVGQANEVHNIGDIWCNILLEMRADLIHSLGFAAGNPKSIQIVTDGMKLDPVSPTLVDARNSILAANCAGYAGANELDIWEGFRVHGMGFRAGYSLGTDGASHVNENFDGPNLTLGNVTATETAGNGNGQFDPGETVSLSIPLSNTLCATSATNTSVTLSPGGGVANYGTIAPGGNGTQAISFTIPTSAACGSAIPITIIVNSTTLGPITYSYSLPIGQRAALSSYENFDGVTAPALPTGWTTSHSGAGLGWATTTTNPDTSPNAAATGDQPNEGTNSLISPSIPINTALGQLSFRNLYNLESGFDAESLQIKIGGGAFQDIIAAGGSFVSGGYNTNIGWTGLSGGTTAAPTYITTVVNLPAAANGQFIQLRWTVHSDANTIAPGLAGASIDTIQLSTTAQPCVTFGAATISISGRVTDGSSNGRSGIQVALSGTTTVTTITDNTGNYSFTSLVSGGNYTITPTTPGFEYTPANRVFNNQTTNVTNADFVAVPAPGIAGRVTGFFSGQGIDGITVTLTGSLSATTTTAGGGFYSFSPLVRGGNYTVTPSGGNNTYSPPSRDYNNLNSAIIDANFVATETVGATPTPTPQAAHVGQVLITEFRPSGPSSTSDEYIELYNNTDGPISIGSYQVAVFFGGGDATLTLPATTVIPRRGHYLIVGNAYSLAAYATTNITVTTSNFIADNSGAGLLDPATGGFIDSIGFVNQSGALPYIEGVGVTRTTKPAIQYAYIRKINAVTGLPQDTDNNANDFQLVSVTGALFAASGGGPTVQSTLGAPGPQNTTSPVVRDGFLPITLLDPAAPSTNAPNRARDFTPDPINNSAFGTLAVRRTVTNLTGVSITRLRFRVVDITTFAGTPPAGTADLRARTSTPPPTITITGTSPACPGGTCQMTAVTLESPPTQSLGGGLNSSLTVGTVTLGTPIPNGGTINLEFLLGVQQTGRFRFFVNVEALP